VQRRRADRRSGAIIGRARLAIASGALILGGLAAVPASGSARTATTAQLNSAARHDAALLSGEILRLAKNRRPGVSFINRLEAYHPKKRWDVAELALKIHNVAENIPHGSGRYDMDVRFPQPIRNPPVVDPPLSSDAASSSQGVIISDDGEELALLRDNGSSTCPRSRPDLCDAGTRGWIVYGGYLTGFNKLVTIEAAAQPTARGERRLTLAELSAFFAQAEQLLGAARASDPITYASGPAFAPLPGEVNPEVPTP
jgi:hypothetical protein